MVPFLFKRSNGIYYICYEDNGRRRWKSTDCREKSEARKQLKAFIPPVERPALKGSLNRFMADFLAYISSSHSPKTQELYCRAFNKLNASVGDKPLIEIDARDADLFFMNRAKEVSPAAANIDLKCIRAAFSMACRWKLIAENPFTGVKTLRTPDRQPLYFTKEDFQKLLSEVTEEWFRDLLIVAASTGMRRGELLNLTWKDVDLANRLIHIRSGENFLTKAGKMRAMPMNETVFQIVSRKAGATSGDYVFTFNGKLIEGNMVNRKLKRCILRVGLNSKLHFHSLRHTFATWLVQEKVSIYEVQKLLGHSSIAVTQIYSHLATSELHSAVEKISIEFKP